MTQTTLNDAVYEGFFQAMKKDAIENHQGHYCSNFDGNFLTDDMDEWRKCKCQNQ